MKINYNVQGKARKALVNAIAEILGETAEYQGTPSYAYVIGKYTVDKNGMLEGRKNANLEAKLAEQGFASEEETPAEIAPEIEEVTAPESETQVDDGDSPESLETGETEADNGEISESESVSETLQALGVGKLSIAFPLDGFSPATLDNLNKMVISKAPLIKKALGVEELPILQDEVSVAFPWFSVNATPDEVNAYSQFICQLCKTAQAKTRVTAKEQKSFENEKFSMRVWMISLDMKGVEYAHARKILMQNLDGNSGYRYEDKQPRNPRSGGTSEPKQVVSVRFTEDMLDKIAELAGQSGMSRNALIESVVVEYVQSELPETTESETSESE